MVPAKSASQAANGRNLTSYKHQARWGQLSAPHYHGGSRSELKLGKCWSALTDVIYIWRSLMGFLGGLKSRPWPLTFTFHRPDRGNCRQQVATILHTYTLSVIQSSLQSLDLRQSSLQSLDLQRGRRRIAVTGPWQERENLLLSNNFIYVLLQLKPLESWEELGRDFDIIFANNPTFIFDDNERGTDNWA